MKRANKYTYYKIIQGNYGTGWNDEDFHSCDSSGFFRTPEAGALFRENLRAYRENGCGVYRVVFRRELNN